MNKLLTRSIPKIKTIDENNLQNGVETKKTNNKEKSDKLKPSTTPTSSQTSTLSKVYHQPNTNHKLISFGKKDHVQLEHDENQTNNNHSTNNDQKIPKEIRINLPPKRKEEQKNNNANPNIKYKHYPNKQIWHPVLHHQGVWTYNQIEENFNDNLWEGHRNTNEEHELSDNASIPELCIKHNDDTSISDDDSTIDDDIARYNDFIETTNINKDVKKNKSITNNEQKEKRSNHDITSTTNASCKVIIEDKRTTINQEEKEKQNTTSDNNRNTTNEEILDNNMTFGNELTQKKKDITRILYSNVRGLELSTESHTLEVLCDFILKHEVDICGMAETNTHWKHPKGKKKIKSMTHRY